MTTGIITTIVGLFCTITSGVVTFILTKKKYNTEVESQQIQNLNTSFDGYKKMVEDTLELQNKKIETLERENENLRHKIEHLQEQLSSLLLEKLTTTKKTK